MARTLRQRWDAVKDEPIFGKPDALQEYKNYQQANSREIPDYRCKFITLAGGQYEVSVTPANPVHVMNARMGFNPLLDCPRKERDAVEQEERDIENRERAAKRARQNVRLKVKSLFADHLLTFNYRAAVFDRETVARDWKEFVRLFRVRYPLWSYVAVLEKHDSEKTSEEKRGSYHIHVAVKGRQDIKWLLRCWLLAIGQSRDDVAAWLNSGKPLGEKSMGNVDVQGPEKRWGSKVQNWNAGKLAGYLTKYIGKEFTACVMHAKKYWHSLIVQKPVVERFWLKAKTYLEAIQEAHALIYAKGVQDMSIWADNAAGVVWITGQVPLELVSWEHCKQVEPEWEFFRD